MAKKVTNKAISKMGPVAPNNATPSATSVLRVLELAKMLSKGRSRQSIIEYAMQKYEINETMAKNYYAAAARYLIPDDMDEYRKGIIQANMERLETIIDKCMESGQYKVAREAIAELNKMFGINSGLQIGIQTDNENNTQQVVIKFDQ